MKTILLLLLPCLSFGQFKYGPDFHVTGGMQGSVKKGAYDKYYLQSTKVGAMHVSGAYALLGYAQYTTDSTEGRVPPETISFELGFRDKYGSLGFGYDKQGWFVRPAAILPIIDGALSIEVFYFRRTFGFGFIIK